MNKTEYTETEDDRFVKQNFRRLPWWVTPRMLDPDVHWSDDSVYLWMVPDCRFMVRRLKNGKKGHRGKIPEVPFDLFGSAAMREAIERWGGK